MNVRSGPNATGKLVWLDCVFPTTYAFPALSTAMPRPESFPVPPMYPQYSSAVPEALTFATNASTNPLNVVSGPTVTGKVVSFDWVWPVTYALPDESTAMPKPKSKLAPPM